jgi:hypothetical protein
MRICVEPLSRPKYLTSPLAPIIYKHEARVALTRAWVD